MRLLSVPNARAVWLVDFATWSNPAGLSLQPLLAAIRDEFNFAKSPQNMLDRSDDQALAFTAGTLVNSTGKIIQINSFNVYNDGFVAETLSNTRDSEDLLRRIVEMVRAYGIAVDEKKIRKIFVSRVLIELDVDIDAVFRPLAAIPKRIGELVPTMSGVSHEFRFGGFGIWSEEVGEKGAPIDFKLEWRWGTPFQAGHYFSQAALPTDDHLRVIAEIEDLLKG